MKSLVISGYLLTSALTTGAGIYFLRPKEAGMQLVPNGRDAAIVKAMNQAKKSILVRTDRFELCEIATVIVNMPRKGVHVTVEVPEEAAIRPRENAIGQILPKEGVSWKVGLEPAEAYKGTLVVVDGETVIYSGSGLNYAPQNSARPYVIGKIKG